MGLARTSCGARCGLQLGKVLVAGHTHILQLACALWVAVPSALCGSFGDHPLHAAPYSRNAGLHHGVEGLHSTHMAAMHAATVHLVLRRVQGLVDGVHSAGGFVQPALQVLHVLLVQVCLLGKVGPGSPLRLEQLLERCAVLAVLLTFQHTPPQLTAQCAMGVVLLPRHTAKQGVQFSVRDFTDFQVLRHVQRLPRLCHGHDH